MRKALTVSGGLKPQLWSNCGQNKPIDPNTWKYKSPTFPVGLDYFLVRHGGLEPSTL